MTEDCRQFPFRGHSFFFRQLQALVLAVFFRVTVIYLDLFLVVLVYNIFYVAHAAVANLNCNRAKYFP